MEILTRDDQRAVLAELLGTMFFVVVGTGSVATALATAGELNAAALIVIALGHGIGILVAVAWTAEISGGHINPAVTLAMFVAGKIRLLLAIAYIVAQAVGAALGALIVKLYLPDRVDDNVGLHQIAQGVADAEGLFLEIVLTAFLVLVIFGTAVSNKGWGINAPLAIGLAIVAIHLAAVPLTGASVNPARSFGPALINNEWKDFWIYVLGPAVGGVIIGAGWLGWRSYGEPLDD